MNSIFAEDSGQISRLARRGIALTASVVVIAAFGLATVGWCADDWGHLRVDRDGNRFTLQVCCGTTNQRFLVETAFRLGAFGADWAPLTILDGKGPDIPFALTIDPVPSSNLRFLRIRHVERPVVCDLESCLRETSSGSCPIYGPPDLATNRDSAIPSPQTPVKSIRIAFHILSHGDQTEPVVDPEALASETERLNQIFRPWRMQFVSSRRILPDDSFRELDSAQADIQARLLRRRYGTNQMRQLDIFITDVQDLGFGGSSVFPWLIGASDTRSGIVMNARRLGADQLVLAHEVGHSLGLWHTHRGATDEEVAPGTACRECAFGGDRDRSGDFCSDTVPTPVDSQGLLDREPDPCSHVAWPITGIGNLMSAYPYGERLITPQQAGRMHCWITNKLSGWLDTNTPAAPSELRVTANHFGEVELNWTDNSWNETGFRVERAVDGGEFVTLTNLTANLTAFFDDNSVPGAKNSYRVFAVNTNGPNGEAASYASWPAGFAVPIPIAPITYVDVASPRRPPDGSEALPFLTFADALAGLPIGPRRILRVSGGDYPESLLISNQAVRLEARGGRIVIGQLRRGPP